MALQGQGTGYFRISYADLIKQLDEMETSNYRFQSHPVHCSRPDVIMKIPKKFIPPKPNSGVYKDFYE